MVVDFDFDGQEIHRPPPEFVYNPSRSRGI
jgi:hypothetical protein